MGDRADGLGLYRLLSFNDPVNDLFTSPRCHLSRPTIDDPHAPLRLRGRTIRAIVDEVNHKLVFECELPEIPTQEEVEYLKTSVERVCKVLRQEFAGMIEEGQTVSLDG